jgi:hypothetical protein
VEFFVRSVILVLCSLLAAGPAFAADPYAKGLNRFVSGLQCDVFSILDAIRKVERVEPEPGKGDGRFLVLEIAGNQNYVQCHFEDEDRRLHCEAASGYYGPSPERAKSNRALYALEKLGFAGDPAKENYWRDFDVDGPASLWNASSVMLEALYRGYGAKANRPVTFKAPLVDFKKLAIGKRHCELPPTSQPGQ